MPEAAAPTQQKNVYVVKAIPLRDTAGAIVGWVRADIRADGTRPTDTIFLSSGTARGQGEALKRIALDPSLLYATEAEAVHDGLARLRMADAGGWVRPV